MEEISKPPTGYISISRDKNKVADHQNGLSFRKKKKRSAAMEVIKAALFMLRQKSSISKSIQANIVVSRNSWKGLVGSMRPMHLQTSQSPTPAIEAKPTIITEPMPVGEQTEEEANTSAPLSPTVNSTAFSISSYGSVSDMSQYEQSPNLMANVLARSSAFSMSSYGSASDISQYESPNLNLQDIHVIKPCEEINGEVWYDDDGGDEMIDAKAEEFIAQFYEQMRLQNLNL